ncbi:efflux RND transporter periplasmic adaptor subunit [Marinobacterium sp. YM272]|uniref:efflux RND transporter periplasmic adaptor subunit n=1 Tax=Marinobacterium sp. YM272 TaxID=3421654 RepID=UPI003D7FCA2B
MSAKSFIQRHLKWLLPILIILLAVFSFRVLKATRPQAPAQPISERSWSVHAVSVTPEELQPQVTLYGAVETPQMATLSAAVEADVIAISALEGEQVDAGTPLLRLDPRDVEISIRQLQAQLDSASAQVEAEKVRHRSDLTDLELQQELVALKEQDLQRYNNLVGRNLVSQQQIDSAQTALQQQRLNLNSLRAAIADHPHRLAQLNAEKARLQASLESLQLDLDRTQIKAPYAARVAAVHVARGDRVRNGDALIDLYDLEQLEVRAQIPERLLSQLRPFIRATDRQVIAHTRLDGEPLKLRLDRLGATVSSGKAGVDALFRFIDPGLIPEPGRSLSLELSLPPQPDLIALPPTALYGTDRVYRVVESRLEPVQVQRVGQLTRSDGADRILVKSDSLRAGEQVITTQLPNAIAGLLVQVTEKAAE